MQIAIENIPANACFLARDAVIAEMDKLVAVAAGIVRRGYAEGAEGAKINYVGMYEIAKALNAGNSPEIPGMYSPTIEQEWDIRLAAALATSDDAA